MSRKWLLFDALYVDTSVQAALLSPRPRHSAGGSSKPKEEDLGVRWGAKYSSPPQREGPCSWAADESWPADRGPSAGGRCYCEWERHTTEESLPLTDVSFRAPWTAWHCSFYAPYIRYCSRAYHMPVLYYACVAEGAYVELILHFSPFMRIWAYAVCFHFCLQWGCFYLQGWVLLLHRGCLLYEQRFNMSPQITLRLSPICESKLVKICANEGVVQWIFFLSFFLLQHTAHKQEKIQ